MPSNRDRIRYYNERPNTSNPRLRTSVRGRASGNGRTAGGTMQTLGDGRGGMNVSRRRRYYDVRVGLGLAGG